MLRARIFERIRPEYHWVPLESISPNLAIAAVAAEDQKFPDHSGFDLDAIADALERNRSDSGAVRGGSTITQQVAKNLYLWPAQSLVRKAAEAWLTAWIELLWPKRRILEVYLNVVEFAPGVYGVAAASYHYFNRLPERLTEDQAALLAAALPDPAHRRVGEPSQWLEQRRGEVRDEMRRMGSGALGELRSE